MKKIGEKVLLDGNKIRLRKIPATKLSLRLPKEKDVLLLNWLWDG